MAERSLMSIPIAGLLVLLPAYFIYSCIGMATLAVDTRNWKEYLNSNDVSDPVIFAQGVRSLRPQTPVGMFTKDGKRMSLIALPIGGYALCEIDDEFRPASCTQMTKDAAKAAKKHRD